MSLLKNYTEGDYEIIQYTGGGSIRERLTGTIVASFTNYWSEGDSIHPKTAEELQHIKAKLGVEITY